MQLSTQETLWLIVILIYIAGMCVSVAMKPPLLGRGRLYWALAIGAFLLALSFDHQRFETLMTEDGPAEWATFYAFLFAGGTFARRAWQQHASARWVQPFVLSLLALFCFFVAGEEISWAQRIFGFKPPEVFLEYNFQQETNVHNFLKEKSLWGVSLDSKNLVVLLACFFGALLPLSGRHFPRLVKPITAIVPDLRFMGFFLLVAWVEWAYPLTYSGEAAELYLGFLFFLSQGTLPRRGNHFVMVAVLLLGLTTPLCANHLLYGRSEKTAAIAREELKQIGTNLLQTGVLQQNLFKKSSIHKRLFTAERVGYFKPGTNNQFLKGQASALYAHGRKDRFGFYLDPWNNPYWIKWQRRQRQLIIYSFGPNRRRDLSFEPEIDLQPDDIAITLRVPKRYLQQK